MQVPIKRTIEGVPGGMMIVPLFFGAIIRTLAPGTPTFFGSFTGALFTGALTILAVFYVCMGATIEFRATPYIVKKGGALFAAKVSVAVIAGIILGRIWGEAPVTADDSNGGLYMALMGQFGSARDVAAYSIMSVESGPFLTMVTLGVAGLSAFPWQSLVGAILPLAIGMILGNLDREMRDFLARAVPVMIPFFAFALGANIDLTVVWKAGLLGIFLGVAVVIVTGAALFVVDRLTGGNGVAGLAAASTAGNAAAVPAIVAAANPVYKPAAASATVLVATSVVVTAILVPIVTAWWYRRVGRPGAPKERLTQAQAETASV